MAAVVIVIVMAFISWTHGQVVTVTPTGPLCIAINTERTITCSVSGAVYIGWRVIFKSSTPEIGLIGEIVPGINITNLTKSSYNSSLSSLIVNTTNTSIIGLECRGIVFNQKNTARINLTIYGVPAAPENLTVQVDSDSLLASWTYDIIETVCSSFNLSLHYSEPSKLVNQTVGAADIKSYNFSLEGVRSCDYFKLCVGASNVIGQGDDSCIEGSLIYIPPVDMITYSLSRATANTNFTVTVTVMMPATCRLSVQNSFYILEVIGDLNGAVRSDPVSINSTSHLQVHNLPRNLFYNFRIISNNSIGEESSALLNFFTSDVQGVNICPTDEEGVYNISCNYVSGGEFNGCGYCLTGGTNLTAIKGNITGTNSNMIDVSNIMEYDYIIINSSDGMIIKNESFNFSTYPISCLSTTEPIDAFNTTDNPTTNNSVVPTAVIVALLLVLLAFLVLLVAAAAVAFYLHRHGYSLRGKVSKAGSSTDSRACLQLNIKRAPEVGVDSGNQEDNGIGTAHLYSSLNSLNYPQGTSTKEKAAGADYSQLKQEPLYSILEKDTPQKVRKKAPQEKEVISADPDAPAIPPFCPPPRTEVEQTISTAADFMYAEVGNVDAAKK